MINGKNLFGENAMYINEKFRMKKLLGIVVLGLLVYN